MRPHTITYTSLLWTDSPENEKDLLVRFSKKAVTNELNHPMIKVCLW